MKQTIEKGATDLPKAGNIEEIRGFMIQTLLETIHDISRRLKSRHTAKSERSKLIYGLVYNVSILNNLLKSEKMPDAVDKFLAELESEIKTPQKLLKEWAGGGQKIVGKIVK